jgi:hypothetical protein
MELPFDPEAMDREFGGRFRIGVVAEAAPHGWETFKKLSGMDPTMARIFEETCGETTKGDAERGKWGRTMPGHESRGNPIEWRASFQQVPRKSWRTVEKRESGIWVTYVDLSDRGRVTS